MMLFTLLTGGVPFHLNPSVPPAPFTISATAPRILLNNTDVMNALIAEKNALTTPYTRFRDMVDTEVAFETTHASDYASGTLASKVAAGYGNIYHMGSNYASNVTYWGYLQWHTALMYKLTGDTNYAQHAHDRVMEFISAEEYFIGVATSEGPTTSTSDLTRPRIAGDSYLEIGMILEDIMLVLDWTSDVVGLWSTSDKDRICSLANHALSNLWGNPAEATWGGVLRPWTGWTAHNDNEGNPIPQPGNNYYFSFLKATVMTALGSYGHQQSQALAWLTIARDERILDEMETYNTLYLSNGGSQEGTGYGMAHRDMFVIDYTWVQSTGEVWHTRTTHPENSGFWLLHNVFPGGDYIVNMGDQARDSTGATYDYHRMYAYAGGVLFPTNVGYRCARYVIETIGGLTQAINSHNRWSDLLIKSAAFTALNPQGVVNTCYYNASTGYIATRTSWAANAILVTFMCGPFRESHAHQDQGSFMVIKGNNALLDDANARSSSGLVPHVCSHNNMLFYDSTASASENDKWIAQVSGSAMSSQLLALYDDANYTYKCSNILPIYDGNPKVTKSQVEQIFLKRGCVVRFDRAAVNTSSVHRVFNLNMSVNPTISGNQISFTKGSDTLRCWRIAPSEATWASEALGAGQWRSGESYSSSYRAYSANTTGTETLALHVVDINGAVSSVVASDDTGQTGVTITFTDGAVAIVRFNNTSTGGSLDYRQSAGGVVIYNAALPTGVVVPPLTL